MAIIVLYIVKVGLNGLSCTQTIARSRNHVISITGNATFPTPFPTMAALTAQTDDTEAAELQYQLTGSRLDKVARDERWAELRLMINDLSGYVTSMCSGNREKILSSGFGTRALPSAPVPLPAPLNVRADQTLIAGEIKIRWRAVLGGAFLTAMLFPVGKYLISFHINCTHVSHAYGAAGAVGVVLVWIYYSTVIMLFGARYTHVRTRALRGKVEPGPRTAPDRSAQKGIG